jgi:hypothetical protein
MVPCASKAATKHDTDDDWGRAVLMPSTPFACSHVVSRRFAYFRVVDFDISAGQRDFCDGFDSRQLHKKECSSEHVLLEKFGLLGHILGTLSVNKGQFW